MNHIKSLEELVLELVSKVSQGFMIKIRVQEEGELIVVKSIFSQNCVQSSKDL